MVSLFGYSFGSSSSQPQVDDARPLPSSSSSSSSSLSTRSSSPDVVVASSAPTGTVAAVNPLNPKGLKPCCACPETKSARDECFLKSSPAEADENCRALVEAHKACMRGYGFKV